MKSKILMATVCLSALMTTEIYGSFQEQLDESVRATTVGNEVRDAAVLLGVPAANLLTELNDIRDVIDNGATANIGLGITAVRTSIDSNDAGNAHIIAAVASVKNRTNPADPDALTAINNVRHLIDDSNAADALTAINNVRNAADGTATDNAQDAITGIRNRLTPVPAPAGNALGDLDAAINLVNGAALGRGNDLTTSLTAVQTALGPITYAAVDRGANSGHVGANPGDLAGSVVDDTTRAVARLKAFFAANHTAGVAMQGQVITSGGTVAGPLANADYEAAAAATNLQAFLAALGM